MLAAAQAVPPARPALDEVVAGVWADARVGEVEPMPGGLGSVLHRVDLDGAPVAAVVLRQLLPEFNDDTVTVRREEAVLRAAAGAGLPVPAVHWTDPDGGVLGRPALLLDLVPGRTIVADLASDAGRRAMATVLHALAAVDGRDVPGLKHLVDLEAVTTHFWPPGSSEVVDVPTLEAAVTAHVDAFDAGTSLVHMDLHGGNVLWDGTDVTGVLDWPGAAVGNPLADEAYLWFDTCLAHGREAGEQLQASVDELRPGRPPTRDERRLWRGVALQRGLPTPRPWAGAYRATGVDIDDDTVEERFVALVEEYLGGS